MNVLNGLHNSPPIISFLFIITYYSPYFQLILLVIYTTMYSVLNFYSSVFLLEKNALRRGASTKPFQICDHDFPAKKLRVSLCGLSPELIVEAVHQIRCCGFLASVVNDISYLSQICLVVCQPLLPFIKTLGTAFYHSHYNHSRFYDNRLLTFRQGFFRFKLPGTF